uniref:Reverse transcriptase domain-containing protein n=1 Tax=Tanacetum cinerariifolium TaxID=118510 RepID=A0A6L2MZH4_TANCI|nr:reverse transcriptase domain-containing protein [Tanacetum cinerariifolium]
MCTRSQSRNNFPQQETSPAIVEPLRIELPFLENQFQEDPLEYPPEVLMANNRTMAELLQEPTEGYEDAIVIPEIAANNFELKHGLINLVQNKQFFGHDKEDPHAHIRYFNKITSTMRVPNHFCWSVDVIRGFALSFQNLNLNARVNCHAHSSSSSQFHPLLPAQCISYYVRFTWVALMIGVDNTLCFIIVSSGMDMEKITRKRPKPDKNEHKIVKSI